MSAAFASTCTLVGGGLIYARVVTDTVGPGATRLLLLAPALCVNVAAPLLVLDPDAEPLFSAIAIANFAWWTNFKLIALAAGRGQLTGPALSTHTFLALAALPVKFADERKLEPVPRGDSDSARRLETKTKTKTRRADPHTARDACVGFACKLAALSFCVSHALPALERLSYDSAYSTERRLGTYVYAKNATYAVALYACLGALFDLGAVVAALIFGATLARHFDLPFLATSFGDFWGTRWNLVAGASLRDAVYAPITEGRFFRPSGEAEENTSKRTSAEVSTSKKKKKNVVKTSSRQKLVGVFACFAVSGLMHEFVLWALVGRSSVSPTRAIGWEWFWFFVSQAPLVSLEYAARKSLARNERAPNTPRGNRVFSFASRAAQNSAFLVAQLALANALFFPPVARNALDARIVADVRRVLGLQKP